MRQKIVGGLQDVVALALAVLLFPLAILMIGIPIALCVRVVFEVVRRL
jgi:hypothetical protein